MGDVLIAGVVLAPNGEPAPGAAVFADNYFMTMGTLELRNPPFRTALLGDDGRWSWTKPRQVRREHQRTKTNAKGEFVFEANDELRGEFLNQRIMVWAQHGELVAPKLLLRATAFPAHLAPLVLGPAMRPGFAVETADGQTVADAFVELTLHVFDEAGDVEELYTLAAYTGEDGIATLPAFPDRDDWHVELAINAAETAPYWTEITDLDCLRDRSPLRVTLPEGCTVRGTVRIPHAEERTGCSITANRDPRDHGPTGDRATLAKPDGTFELRGVPTSAILTFQELPPDISEQDQFLGKAACAQLTVPVEAEDGAYLDLGSIELQPPGSISGVVLDNGGHAPAGGHVMPFRSDAPTSSSSSRSLAPDGTFQIDGLEPGRYDVQATIFDVAPTIEEPHPAEFEATVKGVPTGTSDLEIRVSGGGNLIIRLHPKGEPATALNVWASMLQSSSCAWGNGSRQHSEIRVKLEPGMHHDLYVQAEGHRRARVGTLEIFADRPTFVDVELEPEGAE